MSSGRWSGPLASRPRDSPGMGQPRSRRDRPFGGAGLTTERSALPDSSMSVGQGASGMDFTTGFAVP